ncbi:hypothetical protein O181_074420 [Austropuccinia psidii MF-1]|uniref:Uncharacterized protein n=1 Tax=Austropuccinia psidii MF-1 TaxID=1389203 RepID=A0A9Q3F4I5_9BASI|nr:hypothetical protein [Austropuccinia psidii MF-1]
MTPTLPPHHSLRSRGDLKIYLLCLPQPSFSSPPLTMLMLAWCPPNMPPLLPHISPHHSLCFHTPATHNPYAPVAPSTLLMPSTTCLILFANYHPYTLVVSSPHASNTAPTPA